MKAERLYLQQKLKTINCSINTKKVYKKNFDKKDDMAQLCCLPGARLQV
jgi:hypothetical protein